MILAAVTVLLLAGCNNDVFVEDFEPDEYVYALEGDGAQCEIKYASGDWTYLWVRLPAPDQMAEFVVCDPRGNVITNGRSRSARLEGRGYVHVSDDDFSVYFMRDERDRILVHTELAPTETVIFELSAYIKDIEKTVIVKINN